MSLLSVLFPSAFPALVLAHFVALLSPGPDFFLLVGYAVRYRMRGSTGLCVGIAIGNGLYILLAIIGWGILRQLPLLFTIIELLGALYLLWIGSLLIRSRPQTLTGADARSTCPGFGKQLLLGLGSSLLNPKNALFYLALMTALLGPSVTLLQQTMSGIWMTSVVLCWGSADRDVHRLTADPAAVNQRDLVDRAYRWRCIDYLRLCYRAAVFAEHRSLICGAIFYT